MKIIFSLILMLSCNIHAVKIFAKIPKKGIRTFCTNRDDALKQRLTRIANESLKKYNLRSEVAISLVKYDNFEDYIVAISAPFGEIELVFFNENTDKVTPINNISVLNGYHEKQNILINHEFDYDNRFLTFLVDGNKVNIDLTKLVFFEDTKIASKIVSIDEEKDLLAAVDSKGNPELFVLNNNIYREGFRENRAKSESPFVALDAAIIGDNNAIAAFSTKKGTVDIFHWAINKQELNLATTIDRENDITFNVKCVSLDVENDLCIISDGDEGAATHLGVGFLKSLN